MIFEKKYNLYLPERADEKLAAQLLEGYIRGAEFEIIKTKDSCKITIGDYEQADLSGEYVINVTQKGIYIEGKDFFSLMRGFTTMLTKIRQDENTKLFSIECGKISENSAVGFRSIHFCIFPETKLDFLKKCVRTSGMVQYTHIILEFWGMLKFDCMKELSWPFAYSKEQVKEIVKEANSLGMEVIPMFNHLGHASACREINGKHVVLDQNPDYEYMFKDFGWVWNFENEEVRALLKKVRCELMEICGEGSYFHIGCDEAYTLGQGDNKTEILCNYLNNIEKELEEAGRRAIIWGDMLLGKEEYKDESERYIATSEKAIADEIIRKLDKNIIVADWQYDVKEEAWKTSKKLKAAGFDVLCCPWGNYRNISSAVKTIQEFNLFGMMHTTWHSLDSKFHAILFNGLSCINDKPHEILQSCMNDKPDEISQRSVWHYAAQTVRRVMPAKGDYSKTGWSEKMVAPGL